MIAISKYILFKPTNMVAKQSDDFSAPVLKAQVSYCDHKLSIVRLSFKNF